MHRPRKRQETGNRELYQILIEVIFSFIVELKMLGRRKNMEADGAIAAAFSVLSGKGIDQTIP
jgi:hypothetical protein